MWDAFLWYIHLIDDLLDVIDHIIDVITDPNF